MALMVRLPKELHERLKKMAIERKQSLNSLIVSILEGFHPKNEESKIKELERRLDAIEKEVFRK